MSEVTSKVVYDPSKSYSWSPDEVITLEAGAYGFLLNYFLKREVELRPELEIIGLLKSKLIAMVEDGRAVERTNTVPEVVPEVPVAEEVPDTAQDVVPESLSSDTSVIEDAVIAEDTVVDSTPPDSVL